MDVDCLASVKRIRSAAIPHLIKSFKYVTVVIHNNSQ